MELFEILFVLFFFVLPLLQGLFSKNRKKKPGQPGESGRLPREAPSRGPEGRQGPREQPWEAAEGEGARSQSPASTGQGPASDMVPDDLWELLTGERRRAGTSSGTATEPEGVTVDEQDRWSAEPSWSPEPLETEIDRAEERPLEAAGLDELDTETDLGPEEPVSLEYVGPEAYSLEGPPPPPEVRHRQFHEMIDRTAPRRQPVSRQRPLLRTLHDPQGVRDAVLIAEILGPPKGLP